MLRLLKKLFSTRDGPRTVVVIKDDGTKPSTSHRLNPAALWLLVIGVIATVIILVIVLIRFTPVGGLVYNQEKMRNSVIAIQQKVASLHDTIQARNLELKQMQHIIIDGKDTTFDAGPVARNNTTAGSNTGTKSGGNKLKRRSPTLQLPADAVMVSNFFSDAPEFPAPYPIKGSDTRAFNIKSGHYGLDIAASSGDSFRAVANGVIINEQWTFNYGYVIIVQHATGVISIYKHAQTLAKAIGETVQQGNILGTIGNVGMLSSGPHLHIEIWKNGIPQDPKNYLIKS